MSKPNNEFVITIDEEGVIQFIYDDRLHDLLDEGDKTITRASHVEPDVSMQWTADMGPVNGPTLGPFEFRADALEQERQWLIDNFLTV